MKINRAPSTTPFGGTSGAMKAAALPGVGWWRRPRRVDSSLAGESEPVSAALLAELMDIGAELASNSGIVVESSMATAARSHQQSLRILEVSGMSEQIRTAAETSAGSAGQAVERVDQAIQAIHANEAIFRQRGVLIETITDSVVAGTALMDEIAAAVKNIESTVLMIREIADQTNLLALNAAIEAARAGEHGTGFNVVAKEIRTLADRTTLATSEIGGILANTRDKTTSASALMHSGHAAVEQSRSLESRAADALLSIRSLVEQVGLLTREQSAAASQQIDATRLVNDHVRALSSAAADCTDDSDASAERVTQMIDGSARLNRSLRQMQVRGSFCSLVRHDQQSGIVAETVEALDSKRPHTEQILLELRALCEQHGPAALQCRPGSTTLELCFGVSSIGRSTEIVDRIYRSSGLGATIFQLTYLPFLPESGSLDSQRRHELPAAGSAAAKSSSTRGEAAFLRIATSVTRADGSRATGTLLNPRGAVRSHLLAGRRFVGFAYIFGRPHLGAYEPILSAAGEVIGALYVGAPARFRQGREQAARVSSGVADLLKNTQ